jgi:hypothetical protein
VPPKPVPFETLHEGSAIRFLGSVYATAQNISNMTFWPVWFSFFLTSFSENLAVGRIWLCRGSEYH